jgi:leucyl aminopeptidase
LKLKKIVFEEKSLREIEADVEIVIVVDEDFDHRFVKEDRETLKKVGFSGKQDETLLLPNRDKIYVGASSMSAEDVRSASAVAVRTLSSTKYKSAKMAIYMNHQECTSVVRGQAEGLLLGGYRFEKYKSVKGKGGIERVILSIDEYNDYKVDTSSVKRAIEKGSISAEATNFVRDIVNTPPEDIYPKSMADIAKELAEDGELECRVFGKRYMKKEGMSAMLAVGRASRHKPKLIHLTYKPKKPKAVVSIIGKGLTYDSGGLSLKPSESMVTMKLDKSGASVVLGVMKAMKKLNLDIVVHGFIGAVENMIGGDAYKPDDVLKAKNGKTIEVRNTDAEGRLVLADVLCYAQEKVKADYIFDLATLTGACIVGLGEYSAGVMGNYPEPIDRVLYAGNILAGERVTKLSFNRFLKKSLESKIADISNISNSRYGGAITAGLFLSEFIDEHHKDKWGHIDIAGPSFVERDWGENPHGASGFGVRLMIRLLEKLDRGEEHRK